MLPSSYFGIPYFSCDMKEPLHVIGELCTLSFPVALLTDKKGLKRSNPTRWHIHILDPNCLFPP